MPCSKNQVNPLKSEPKVGVTIHYMDASALIKYFYDEENSDIIRSYVHDCIYARKSFEIVFRTTSFCFGETLGFFKTKVRRKEISKEEYSIIAMKVIDGISGLFEIEEPSLSNASNYSIHVSSLIKKYGLDVSDAFQLVAIKSIEAALNQFSGGIRVILITADKGLARAAKEEGIRSWNISQQMRP